MQVSIPCRQPRQHPTTQFFLQAGCPSWRPTNSVKALKVEPKIFEIVQKNGDHDVWLAPPIILLGSSCSPVSAPMMATNFRVKIVLTKLNDSPSVALAFQNGLEYHSSDFNRFNWWQLFIYIVCKFGEIRARPDFKTVKSVHPSAV